MKTKIYQLTDEQLEHFKREEKKMIMLLKKPNVNIVEVEI